MLLLYTDGLTEARRDGEEYGEPGLFAFLAAASGSAADVAGDVAGDVVAFSQGMLRDDLAVLAIEALDRDLNAPGSQSPSFPRPEIGWSEPEVSTDTRPQCVVKVVTEVLCTMEAGEYSGIALVELHGDVDGTACPDLEQLLLRGAAGHGGKVILDLLDIRYMESAPIGTLVKVDRVLDARGGGLAIASQNDDLNKLFATAGLHDFMHVFPDLDSAAHFLADKTSAGGSAATAS